MVKTFGHTNWFPSQGRHYFGTIWTRGGGGIRSPPPGPYKVESSFASLRQIKIYVFFFYSFLFIAVQRFYYFLSIEKSSSRFPFWPWRAAASLADPDPHSYQCQELDPNLIPVPFLMLDIFFWNSLFSADKHMFSGSLDEKIYANQSINYYCIKCTYYQERTGGGDVSVTSLSPLLWLCL